MVTISLHSAAGTKSLEVCSWTAGRLASIVGRNGPFKTSPGCACAWWSWHGEDTPGQGCGCSHPSAVLQKTPCRSLLTPHQLARHLTSPEQLARLLKTTIHRRLSG